MNTSTEANNANAGALYRLLAWLSPAFPIGAFSYSHGLEAAVETGSVHDRPSLEGWVEAIVLRGSGRMDADILRDAYRAAADDDAVASKMANRRGIAYRATAELALENQQQGAAFRMTWRAAWADPHPPSPAGLGPTLSRNAGEGLEAAISFASRDAAEEARELRSKPLSRMAEEGGGARSASTGEGVCYPAAFGMVAARAGIALDDALLGYLQAFAANLISAGMRLGIVGQTDGQRILAALEPKIVAAAGAALPREPADFGSATFAVDLASMAHETQYTRLFRS
jgi:urease accessory protein